MTKLRSIKILLFLIILASCGSEMPVIPDDSSGLKSAYDDQNLVIRASRVDNKNPSIIQFDSCYLNLEGHVIENSCIDSFLSKENKTIDFYMEELVDNLNPEDLYFVGALNEGKADYLYLVIGISGSVAATGSGLLLRRAYPQVKLMVENQIARMGSGALKRALPLSSLFGLLRLSSVLVVAAALGGTMGILKHLFQKALRGPHYEMVHASLDPQVVQARSVSYRDLNALAQSAEVLISTDPQNRLQVDSVHDLAHDLGKYLKSTMPEKDISKYCVPPQEYSLSQRLLWKFPSCFSLGV